MSCMQLQCLCGGICVVVHTQKVEWTVLKTNILNKQLLITVITAEIMAGLEKNVGFDLNIGTNLKQNSIRSVGKLMQPINI